MKIVAGLNWICDIWYNLTQVYKVQNNIEYIYIRIFIADKERKTVEEATGGTVIFISLL